MLSLSQRGCPWAGWPAWPVRREGVAGGQEGLEGSPGVGGQEKLDIWTFLCEPCEL